MGGSGYEGLSSDFQMNEMDMDEVVSKVKLMRYNGDVYQAVNEWCSDPEAAEEKYGHISEWDVSKVTSMRELFKDKKDFNDDLSRWDVSNVTDMYWMFYNATSFNSDLSGWNVSNVTNM